MDKLAEVIKEQMDEFRKRAPDMKEGELFDLAVEQIGDSLENYKLGNIGDINF